MTGVRWCVGTAFATGNLPPRPILPIRLSNHSNRISQLP